jgi:hypothetical protein
VEVKEQTQVVMMWKRYMELERGCVNFERVMYAELSAGLARNVNEISIKARIDVVARAYHRDGFAESNNEVLSLLSPENDNTSDDE